MADYKFKNNKNNDDDFNINDDALFDGFDDIFADIDSDPTREAKDAKVDLKKIFSHATNVKSIKGALIDNLFDATVDNKFCTDNAWLMCHVHNGIFDVYVESARLNDCVLFGMHGITKFGMSATCNVEFATQTFAFVFATFYTTWSTVISCCYNTFVFYNDCTNLPVLLITAGPRCNKFCHIHKSLIPFIHK